MSKQEKNKLKYEAWIRGYKNWTAFNKCKPDEAQVVKKEVTNIIEGQKDLF